MTFLQFQAVAFNRAFLLLQKTGSDLTRKDVNELGDVAGKAWSAWSDFKSTRSSGNMAQAEDLIRSVIDILKKGKGPA